MTWEQIFEQTDRDINLQRVMNVLPYGKNRRTDWIPDRAIGPTDDEIYDAESEYNDNELRAGYCRNPTPGDLSPEPVGKTRNPDEFQKKTTSRVDSDLLSGTGLDGDSGIPTIDTLIKIGLWNFLKEETKAEMTVLAAADTHRGRSRPS